MVMDFATSTVWNAVFGTVWSTGKWVFMGFSGMAVVIFILVGTYGNFNNPNSSWS